MGIELMTSSLPRMRSTPELHRRHLLKCGAENEVRTRDPQLGRLMLYQLSYFRKCEWEKMDSNHRRHKSADLQSAPFGHSGILPIFHRKRPFPELEPIEGFEPTTPRLQITCSGQLSYIGNILCLTFRKGLQR